MVSYPSVTLKFLLAQAYGLPMFQVAGPDWLGTERYEILATVPPGTTEGQKRLMLRNLLSERFRLSLHRETRTFPIYALVVGRNGPKLTESPPPFAGEANAVVPAGPRQIVMGKDGFALPPPGYRGGINIEFGGPGRVRLSSVRQPLPKFCEFLSGQLQRLVIDKTGLTGTYDIKLDFTPDEDQVMRGPQDEPLPLRRAPPGEEGPSLFTALQEQLGLKLESTKGPVEILVIDRAEKVPAANGREP